MKIQNKKRLWLLILIVSLGLLAFQNGDVWQVSENFDNQNTIFSINSTTMDNGTFTFQNGQVISSIPLGKKFNIINLEQEAPQTLTAKVDVTLVSQDPAIGAGIICNHNPINNDGVFFEMDFDQDAQLYAVYENKFYYLKDFGTDHVAWVENAEETDFLHFSQINTNGTNTIEFTCTPDTYTIAINGSTLGSIPSPFSYSTNNIALFSYTYYDGENKVAFDNFSAKGLLPQNTTASNSKPTANSSSQTTSPSTPWGANTTFSYNDGYFEEAEKESFKSQYINSGLEISVYSPNITVWSALRSESTINNFAEIEFEFVSNDTYTFTGLSCDAYLIDGSRYGTFFIVGADNTYRILRQHPSGIYALINNQWVNVDDADSLKINTSLINPTQANTLKMECDHARRAFYINNQFLLEYQDFEPDYATKIMLIAGKEKVSNDQPSIVRFTRLLAGEIQ